MATTYVIARYLPFPVLAKAPAAKVVAPVKAKPPAPIAIATNDSGMAPADVLHQASDAAAAVLNAIDALRTTTGDTFVGPGVHQALDVMLKSLEAASNRLQQVSPDNPAQVANAIKAFTAVLDQAAARADQISKRTNESDFATQTAAQVASTLSEIRATLP